MKHVAITILSGTVMLGANLACAPRFHPPTGSAAAGSPSSSAPRAELVSVLPFVENDYASAVRRAREAKLPLFVEVWAPW